MEGFPEPPAADESECRLATIATVAPTATTTSTPTPLSSRAFRRRRRCSDTCGSAVCGCWAVGGPQDTCGGAGRDPTPNCHSGSGRPLPSGAENCCGEGIFAPDAELPAHCGAPGCAPKAVVGASAPPGPVGAPEFHCPPTGFGPCGPPGPPGGPKPCGGGAKPDGAPGEVGAEPSGSAGGWGTGPSVPICRVSKAAGAPGFS